MTILFFGKINKIKDTIVLFQIDHASLQLAMHGLKISNIILSKYFYWTLDTSLKYKRYLLIKKEWKNISIFSLQN